MKPSERIEEIAESKEMPFASRGQVSGYIQAILNYLDEEWARKNHKGEDLSENIERVKLSAN